MTSRQRYSTLGYLFATLFLLLVLRRALFAVNQNFLMAELTRIVVRVDDESDRRAARTRYERPVHISSGILNVRNANASAKGSRLAGLLELHAGNLETSAEWFKNWERMEPEAGLATYFLGEIAAMNGNWTQTIEYWRRAGARASLVEISNTFVAESQSELALEALGALTEVDPFDFNARRTLGDLLMEDGKFSIALKHYLELVDLVPDSPLAYGLVGTAFLATESYPQAASYFSGALQRSPGDPFWILKGLGDAYAGNKDWSEAARAYGEALRHQPHNTTLRLTLGDIYCEQDMPVEALKQYKLAAVENNTIGGLRERVEYIEANFACPQTR